jgi:hypothetical protein
VLGVFADVDASMSRWYARSNGYHLYRAAVDPLVTCTVRPDHSGETGLTAELQLRRSGSWRRLAMDSFRLGDRSKLRLIVPSDALVRGRNYRISCGWQGSGNLEATSPWQYFRVP